MDLCDDELVETLFQKAHLEHLEVRHSLWSAAEAHEAWDAWGMSLMFISQITAQISLQPWIKENYQVKWPSTPNKTIQSNWHMSRSVKTSILFWVWFSRKKKNIRNLLYSHFSLNDVVLQSSTIHNQLDLKCLSNGKSKVAWRSK